MKPYVTVGDDLGYRDNRFRLLDHGGTIHDEPPMAAMEAITRGLAKLAPNTDEEMRRLEAAVAKERLMAAAPDLLAALEGLVGENGDLYSPAAHDAARAAIAKAKGE